MLICVNGGVFVLESVSRWHWCSGRRAPRFGLKSQPHTDRSSSFLMMVPVPLEGGCCHSNRCSLGGMLSARNRVEGGRGNGERRLRKGGSSRAFLTPRQPAHTNEPYISSAADGEKDFHLLCITDTTKTHFRDTNSTDSVCMVFLLD